ncbi:hypothetical protein [Pseudobacteriovorax antillogorgiicola]|uniref:OmpA family protein n=1 Tax=Pseudobacteriovorax antillogorgiicola TaxID=1513793 RepID=A0A1Y6BAT0_9BACT|nr:hypothetical protein [Pseudobacteriovorax antillogorgiicola]TCS57524.1 hypothetical protein EDD56_103264 [Pseudobacteriovorax antillogorgiicola]SMF00077.1 hypothetical protein SAMN06296036_10369 [Pseudobacteriovorax antillogorgiicola]
MSKLLAFLVLLSTSAALSGAEIPDKKPLKETKVFTCNVLFPNDSVAFREERISECFTEVDPELITYIHIVSTASTTGTAAYNLDLSVRRSQKVKRFIEKQFPNVKQIHEFGGGQNPRFGRQARIFIVVQPKTEQEAKEETPIVIKEVEIEKELILAKRGARGLEFANQIGLACVDCYDLDHRSLGVSLRKPIFLKNMPSIRLLGGVQLNHFQSASKKDFQTLDGEFGARYVRDIEILKDSQWFCGASGLAGLATNNDKLALNGGLRTECGLGYQGIMGSFQYTHSYQIVHFGFSLGFEI